MMLTNNNSFNLFFHLGHIGTKVKCKMGDFGGLFEVMCWNYILCLLSLERCNGDQIPLTDSLLDNTL